MQLTAREKWGKPTFASASAFDPTPSEAQGQAASNALEIAGVAGTELGTVDNEKCLSGSFVETGFSAAGGGAPKPFKLVVVQAVTCEPVSRHKFPEIREFTGKTSAFRSSNGCRDTVPPVNSEGYGEDGGGREQGILMRRTAIFSPYKPAT